jgi:hypothetical protein
VVSEHDSRRLVHVNVTAQQKAGATDKERHQFRTNIEQAQILEQLTFATAAWVQDDDEHQKWEKAKQMTRGMIDNMVQEKCGTDFWAIIEAESRGDCGMSYLLTRKTTTRQNDGRSKQKRGRGQSDRVSGPRIQF